MPEDVKQDAVTPDAPAANAGKGVDVQDTFPREYVEQLRAENARWRTELRDLEQQVKSLVGQVAPEAKPVKADDALHLLGERLDSLATSLKEFDQRASRQSMYHALREESIRSGAIDIDAALKLIDPSGVTVDPDGAVRGASEAVAKLVEAKPYLFNRNQPPPNAGPTAPAQGPHDDIAAIQRRVREKLSNPFDNLDGLSRGGGLVLPWEG